MIISVGDKWKHDNRNLLKIGYVQQKEIGKKIMEKIDINFFFHYARDKLKTNS